MSSCTCVVGGRPCSTVIPLYEDFSISGNDERPTVCTGTGICILIGISSFRLEVVVMNYWLVATYGYVVLNLP